MIPITREEIYLTKLAGGSVTVPTPVSRNTLTIDTTLQPSSVSITGKISQ